MKKRVAKHETDSISVSRPELQVEGSDMAFRQLLYDIFSFAHHLQDARAKFAEFIGLSPSQYMILIAISRHEQGDKGINEVAEHLHLSGAFVTIEVNRLVERGYVAKDAHPTDRRRIRLRLTAEGFARLASLAAFQRPVNDALFDGLSAAEFRALRQIMAKLERNGAGAVQLANYLEQQMKAASEV